MIDRQNCFVIVVGIIQLSQCTDILCAQAAKCLPNAAKACHKMARIGIYSGSFDPVHKGHVTFALDAINSARLDRVYFAPEAKPRSKPGITHAAHRLAMIRLSVRLHRNLDLLDLPDKYFSANTTLPRLKQVFPDDELLLLVGSDVLEHMHNWPGVEFLLKHMGLVVAVRGQDDIANALQYASRLPAIPREFHIIESTKPELASRYIRHSLAAGNGSPDILPSVHAYAKHHWLYDDVTTARREA